MLKHAILMLSLATICATSGISRPASAEIGVNKTFGIGLEGAHGPGLSLKFMPASDHALQFGIYAYNYGRYRTYYFNKGHGAYYGYDYGYDSGGFLVHGDYLYRETDLIRSRPFNLPWYAGGGVDVGVGDGALALAVHGNLGLAMQFNAVPLDVFIEWTPRIWLIDFVQLHPADINAGVRFWF